MAQSQYKRWREQLPERVGLPHVAFLAHLDMLFLDHGWLRPWYNRPQEIAPGIWRSNQPTPKVLARLARKQGLRSVINLRGESPRAATVLETHACARLGLEIGHSRWSSRRPPSVARVLELMHWLETLPKPILIHCKSGADRAGLASAIAAHQAGLPAAEVRAQLSWSYWHIQASQTGVLDVMLDAFLAHHVSTGDALQTWLQLHYQPDVIQAEFKPKPWAAWCVDFLLRRE